MDLPGWVDQGRRLGRHARWSKWWVGDWLMYGNSRWGEKYRRASNVLGYDVKTLANIVYVARRFEPSRRRENLSWSHHEAVAALPIKEQDAWLDRASNERLSVRDVRHEVQRRSQATRRVRLEAVTGGRDKPAAPTNFATTAVLMSHLVRDLDASIRFYEAFGLEVIWRGSDGSSAFLGAPAERPCLELAQATQAELSAGHDGRDRRQTTVWVSDIQRLLGQLGQAGPIRASGDPAEGICFVSDPDGYRVKLVDSSAWSMVVDATGPVAQAALAG